MTFQESDLQFNFASSQWQVLKYDTHKYYKTLSGVGLKGVDFVGIYEKDQLVFFEIKHYRTHKTLPNATFVFFEDTPLFIQHIQDKMDDTVTAIKVIIKYLKRKFWYRSFLKLERFIPIRLIINKDWYFWHQLHKLWKSNASKTFLLWLEVDSNYSIKATDDFLGELQTKLSKAFEDFDFEPIIANMEKPVFTKGLKVKKGT